MRSYPVKSPSSAPATGRILYEYLMRNIKIPAGSNHEIWYSGEKLKLENPQSYAFRGDIPTGKTLELLSLGGRIYDTPINHTFTGEESYVLVSDLTSNSKRELEIPVNARARDKVFNANFKSHEDLPLMTKMSSELAAMSVPKSISSYLAGVRAKVNYSEVDIFNLLNRSFEDLSSNEMMHFLHGSHLAWASLAYLRDKGNVAGDIMTEFHSQNATDFYTKDLGSILPAMFFALANLGQDPVRFKDKLDIEIYGVEEAANYMRKFMPK